ncbi:MAG: C45 family peptidase [Chloroflexota bacterium]
MNIINGIDQTTFDLTGNHYDIGVAIGRGSPDFTLPAWWPEPPTLLFAEACSREIAALHPGLLDEIQGHADGQSLAYDDLLRVICRQRLGGRNVLAPVAPEGGGCTSVAWRTPNGHVVVGRNYDFHEVQRTRQRIRLRPDRSRPTVGMRGSVPAGRYDGVNDAGLFVCLHIVLSDQSQMVRPGIPFHLIPRILLETCSTLREALDTITMMPHLHSFNYLIADPGGFAVVECHADRLRILYPENDILACGNFYRHPDMAPLTRRRQQLVSRQRVAYLESSIWRELESEPLDTMQATMRDHGAAVCGHRGGHTTLWSAVADLTSRRVAYTMGAPCCTDYREIRWPI